MNLQKTIPIRHYECKVCVLFVSNIVASTNALYRKNNDTRSIKKPFAGIVLNWEIDRYYLVLSLPHLGINSITHEAHHIAKSILSDRDIINEENSAWLIAHVVEEIYNYLKKKKIYL